MMDQSEYYNQSCRQYARAGWVHEVADLIVKIIQNIRPFNRNDIIVDYGCGPGLTLEKIFYSRTSIFPLVGKTARICDISKGMIETSRSVASIRCPLKGVWCDKINAFHETGSGKENIVTDHFKEWLPGRIDVAYCSLTAEYLSSSQITALSEILIARLNDGGVLAFFEWTEHFPYSPVDSVGIHHPMGIPKHFWLELAASITRSVENPERVEQELLLCGGPGQHPMFPTKAPYRISTFTGTLDVKRAGEQRCPSGDAVHYLALKKIAVDGREGALWSAQVTALRRRAGLRRALLAARWCCTFPWHWLCHSVQALAGRKISQGCCSESEDAIC